MKPDKDVEGPSELRVKNDQLETEQGYPLGGILHSEERKRWIQHDAEFYHTFESLSPTGILYQGLKIGYVNTQYILFTRHLLH